MNPKLQKKQNESIVHAVCALLNSGGGVVKAETENKDYNYDSHGVGLYLPSTFKGYLDEMQQGDLFLIFRPLVYDLLTLCSSLCHRHRTCTNVMNSQEALSFPKGRIQTLTNINDSNSLSPQKFQVRVQNEGNIKASAAVLFDSIQHLQYEEKLNFTKSTRVEFKMFSTEMTQCFTQGGYVFFGLHDETHQVTGCEKEKTDLATLRASIDRYIRKLSVHHFCTQRREIKYATKFVAVLKQGVLHGYVCAVSMERFCCAVFAKVHNSWRVKDNLFNDPLQNVLTCSCCLLNFCFREYKGRPPRDPPPTRGPSGSSTGQKEQGPGGGPTEARPRGGSQGRHPSPGFLKGDRGLDTDDRRAQGAHKCLLGSAAQRSRDPGISTRKSTSSFALERPSRTNKQELKGKAGRTPMPHPVLPTITPDGAASGLQPKSTNSTRKSRRLLTGTGTRTSTGMHLEDETPRGLRTPSAPRPPGAGDRESRRRPDRPPARRPDAPQPRPNAALSPPR
eukprot:bmy_02907T0